jgi:NACHT domain
MLLTSSTIIQNIWSMYQTGLANLAFFYFDHKDAAKLDARSLLSSLLIQLCNQSDHFCEVLSTLYMAHDRGSRQPGEDELMQCLRDMIRQGKSPVYIIVDALDECPDSTGLGSPRAAVLEIIRGLIGLSPRVYLCITSRPEMDIRRVLRPLTSHIVSLDQHDGQHKDIAEYVKFVVHSDSRMREWPEEDKNLVSKTLTQNCDGMYVVIFMIFRIVF